MCSEHGFTPHGLLSAGRKPPGITHGWLLIPATKPNSDGKDSQAPNLKAKHIQSRAGACLTLPVSSPAGASVLRYSQQQGTRGGAAPAAGELCTEGTWRWREVPRYLFLTQPTLPQGSQGKIVSSSTSTGQQQELKCTKSMRAHAPVPREAP